jgi:hypothetical protein
MSLRTEFSMRKPILLSVVMALLIFAGSSFTPSHAQAPTKDDTPTFYRLTPGVYVNGWPAFTVFYPIDWVEQRPHPGEIFRAAAPGVDFAVARPFQSLVTLDRLTDFVVPFFRGLARDVTVVKNTLSQLRDGTPAWEVELQMVLNDAPFNYVGVAMKKGDLWIIANLGSSSGKIQRDARAIVYSFEFRPDKDEPVKLPLDVKQFLDRYRGAILSQNITKVMAHFSDQYLESGSRKDEVEWFWRQAIGSVTSLEWGITDFVPAGDKAYLAGFINFNTGKWALLGTSIIKENGQWKWYGNQRDPAPITEVERQPGSGSPPH